jgi:serine O-acetyltransferase
MGYLAVWLYRLSHYRDSNGGRFSARLFWQLNLHLTGADIDPRTQAAGGLVIPYPSGVTLYAVAGRDLTLLNLAYVAPEPSGPPPRIADSVTIEPQGLVHGSMSIGEDARVASGCVVTSDVAAGSVLVGPTTLRVRAGMGPQTERLIDSD